MTSLKQLLDLIDQELEQLNIGNHPVDLYEPIRYLLGLGGKRLRPLMVLLSYEMFRDDGIRQIIRPALAVELFHNFTLMHDDIMDKAPLRRGQPTVHEKWNHNTAILSGDVMLVRTYDLFLGLEERNMKTLLSLFNNCAAEVCEGQQLDMEFEKKAVVSVEEYIEMIRLKTAVLIGFSLQMGAILGNGNAEDIQKMNRFGQSIGIGFQLKDDLLDVYADAAKFGKQVGGDIISNKKTFLLIKALELAKGSLREQLLSWLNREQFNDREKVCAIKDIYDELEIKKLTEAEISRFFEDGFSILESISVPHKKKDKLLEFINALLKREN